MKHLGALPSHSMQKPTLCFALKLRRQATGEVDVMAAEILGDTFTNRTEFRGSALLGDVLVPDLRRAVADVLTTVGQERTVVPLPELAVELVGLSLRSAQVIAGPARGDTQSITIRFLEMLGAPDRAFTANFGFGDPVACQGNAVAPEMLSDIAMRLLSLCRSEQTACAARAKVGTENQRLPSERAEEVAFYIDLLDRFTRNNPSIRREDETANPFPGLDDTLLH